jgi:phosphoribosyl-ATP pyrophosphohydrolase/phosphoribosyl-AMP cyclohydrolase
MKPKPVAKENLPFKPGDIRWPDGDGLLPAVVQHGRSGSVLMVAWMNRQAFEQTLETGLVTFFSRSRQALWTKGETSGNFLQLDGIDLDCDGDAFLVLAEPTGPVCHRGTPTCFSGKVQGDWGFLPELEELIAGRRQADPQSSYTARLLNDDPLRVAQKVGEEAIETLLASVGQNEDAMIDEAADLVYHLMVLLARKGTGWSAVQRRLQLRHAARSAAE